MSPPRRGTNQTWAHRTPPCNSLPSRPPQRALISLGPSASLYMNGWMLGCTGRLAGDAGCMPSLGIQLAASPLVPGARRLVEVHPEALFKGTCDGLLSCTATRDMTLPRLAGASCPTLLVCLLGSAKTSPSPPAAPQYWRALAACLQHEVGTGAARTEREGWLSKVVAHSDLCHSRGTG